VEVVGGEPEHLNEGQGDEWDRGDETEQGRGGVLDNGEKSFSGGPQGWKCKKGEYFGFLNSSARH